MTKEYEPFKPFEGQKIAIVHDSGSSLPDEYRLSYPGLYEQPFEVIAVRPNGYIKKWVDSPFESVEERAVFIDDLSTAQITTSLPSAGKYLETFNKIIESGIHEIAVVPMSSGTSGSMNSAAQAAEMLKDKANISVADIKTLSMAQGLLVSQADIENKRGEFDCAEEMVTRVNELSKRIFAVQAFSNLEHLRRGGRIGHLSNMVGGILHIKPLLGVDEEGKLDKIAQPKGWKNARPSIIDYVAENIGERSVRLALVHFESNQIDLLRAEVETDDRFNIATKETTPDGKEVKYETLECEEHMVTAAHSGTGVVGLGGLAFD